MQGGHYYGFHRVTHSDLPLIEQWLKTPEVEQWWGDPKHELALIRSLPAHSRCFLVRQPDASVVVRLDLSGAPEVLTMLSGRESSVRRLDLLREAVGDDPAQWYPALTNRPWPGSGQPEEDDTFNWEAAE